jgi:glycosyltransferase involved in cell wall biosynthesis
VALESVVLTGPLAPADVADLLHPADAARAADVDGYRGIPLSELARALVEKGLQVEVVSVASGLSGPMSFEGPRFRVLIAPRRERARARALDLFRAERRALTALLRETEGKVLHAHWTYEFAWAAQRLNRPLVVTAHDAPLTILRHHRDAYRVLRALMAYVVRARLARLTAVSPYLAHRWRREMGYRRAIAIVPNIARLLEGARRAGTTDTPVRLLDVADAGRLKNVVAAIRLVDHLRACGRDVTLTLVGPGLGPEDPLARRFDAPAVGFEGVKDASGLARLMTECDIFVHPSREECCPVAVIEAMRAGLAVIVARDSGGSPWVVGDGEAGLVADVDDDAAFAAQTAAIVDDPAARADLGERARRRAESMFSPAAVVDGYVREFEQVAS